MQHGDYSNKASLLQLEAIALSKPGEQIQKLEEAVEVSQKAAKENARSSLWICADSQALLALCLADCLLDAPGQALAFISVPTKPMLICHCLYTGVKNIEVRLW